MLSPHTLALLGISEDHAAGLVALILTPLAIWLLVKSVAVAAHLGSRSAQRWLGTYQTAPLTLRAASWMLIASASIHFALSPGHRFEAPGVAFLFFLDGVALFGAALLIFRSRRFRTATVVLLIANLAVYVGFLLSKREAMDQLGMATKLAELIALGLILVPHRVSIGQPIRRRRWLAAAATLLLATTLTGAVAWGAQAAASDAAAKASPAEHHHGSTAPLGTTFESVEEVAPTAEQIAAAELFAEQTRQGLSRFEDVRVALADGYRADFSENALSAHYTNKKYEHDGRILDPERPETLVYANTSHGQVLLGAQYQMEDIGQPGADIAGPIAVWHVHSGICFGPIPPFLVGLNSPFGACPSLSISVTSQAMIHVWTVEVPGGAYSHIEADKAAEYYESRIGDTRR